jgi:hypothetical protein
MAESSSGVSIVLSALICGALSAVCSAQTPVTVRLIGGDQREGELVAITADRLQLAPGAETEEIPLGEVISVDFPGRPAPRPPATSRLELRGGDLLFGVIDDGNYDEVRIASAACGVLRLFLDDIEVVAYLDNLALDLTLPPGPPKQDVLMIAQGEGLDPLPGELIRLDRSGVVFSSAAGEERPFSFVKDRVAAVRLAPLEAERPPLEAELLCVARFRDGSRLTGALESGEGGALRLRLALGPTVTLNRAALSSLNFRNEAFAYLSDLPATAFEEVPFIEGSVTFGLRRDRGFESDGPLEVGATRFRKGLGLHARARVSFALAGGFSSFRASVGADPATRDRRVPGSVRVQVLIDGKERWKSGLLVAGDEAVPCELDGLAGTEELTIVADFGSSYQTGARAVLGEAMLLR